MFDTGCELDGAVDVSLLHKFQIQPRSTSITVCCVTGVAAGVLHVSVWVYFGSGSQLLLDLVTLSHLGVDMILGQGFLQLVGTVIDTGAHMVVWTEKGSCILLQALAGPAQLPIFKEQDPLPNSADPAVQIEISEYY